MAGGVPADLVNIGEFLDLADDMLEAIVSANAQPDAAARRVRQGRRTPEWRWENCRAKDSPKGPKGLAFHERIREIPVVKVLHADGSKRIVLPSPVRPHSVWVPILVSEKEIRLIAYEPPKESSRAKGRVVIGKDGLAVWEGEMVMDPVKALNQAREEDANG